MKSQFDFQSYIDTGTQAYKDGDYAAGGKIFLVAMKDAKRAKLKDARLLVILYNLALFYHQQKRPKKAEVLLERALEHAESLFGKNANPVNHILNKLADLQVKERHYRKAESYYNRSLQIERRSLAADNPLLSKKLIKVAWVQALLGNFNDSGMYFKQALELQINAARVKRAYAVPFPAGHLPLDADLLFDDFSNDEEAEVSTINES
jgi:tetratricopeptide (TPR) repeat protein